VRQEEIIPSFALYALYSGLADEFISMLSQGSTVEHFNMSDIANIPVLLPSISSQRQIVRQLDQNTERIDILVDKVRHGIARLKEYRTALISAAVTGRIDVREQV
jgi:type I restriction enzyme S subunit